MSKVCTHVYNGTANVRMYVHDCTNTLKGMLCIYVRTYTYMQLNVLQLYMHTNIIVHIRTVHV